VTQFRLCQNVQSPSSRDARATIQYSVAKAGVVRLEIFDVTGRRVGVIRQNASLGENSAVWDGKDAGGCQVSPGVYFYRMTVGDFSAQRKMLVLE
jgi:flagellar hook assembly protein FlgD